MSKAHPNSPTKRPVSAPARPNPKPQWSADPFAPASGKPKPVEKPKAAAPSPLAAPLKKQEKSPEPVRKKTSPLATKEIREALEAIARKRVAAQSEAPETPETREVEDTPLMDISMAPEPEPEEAPSLSTAPQPVIQHPGRDAEEGDRSASARILALKTSARRKPVISASQEVESTSVEEAPPASWFDKYAPPPLSLLEEPKEAPRMLSDEELLAQARLLEKTLADFGVSARVGEVIQGPVVTLFELKLAAGTKVSRVTSLESDLALGMAAPRVRILAPIPGRASIGVEVPNEHPNTVMLREIISSEEFWRDSSPLLFALGVSIDGSPVLCDLAKMPHLLIAGATGSGKSVALNSIISSILFHMAPTMVRMILIDPKRVELSIYSDIPHLAAPVLCEPEEAAEALAWAVEIMEERTRRLQKMRVRNIGKFNQIALGQKKPPKLGLPKPEYMPHIMIVIDELADLMLCNRQEIETSLVRLAQKARAVGIHLIVATQRPSVDVITGLIRANFPSRVAFQVSDKTDSRIIMQSNGAECLLGRGDMLYSPGGALKPTRLQGAYISEDEVEELSEFLRSHCKPYYMRDDFTPKNEEEEANADSGAINDELYYEALRTVVEKGQATQSALSDRLHIGRTNAGRLLDRMEREGLVERQGRQRIVSEQAGEVVRNLPSPREEAVNE